MSAKKDIKPCSPPWTKEEEAYLIEHHGKKSAIEIGQHLNRQEQNVRTRIKALRDKGVLSRDRTSYLTKNRVAIEDRLLVTEEITYLLDIGHRPQQAKKIRLGMRIAVRTLPVSIWRRYADRPLDTVMDEFMMYKDFRPKWIEIKEKEKERLA